MKRIVVGVALAFQMLGFSVASAQTTDTGITKGHVGPVGFLNNTNSPVWVTVYQSSGALDTWHIVTAQCVLMKAAATLTTSPTGDTGPYQVKLRTESKKGHGDCNTGTYNDTSIRTDGGGNMHVNNPSAQLDVNAQGQSHLYWSAQT
jgi:hypothetical protein